MVQLQNDWDELLAPEFGKEYYRQLRSFLRHAYATQKVYPDMYRIFQAFRMTPYHATRVVILGQDP